MLELVSTPVPAHNRSREREGREIPGRKTEQRPDLKLSALFPNRPGRFNSSRAAGKSSGDPRSPGLSEVSLGWVALVVAASRLLSLTSRRGGALGGGFRPDFPPCTIPSCDVVVAAGGFVSTLCVAKKGWREASSPPPPHALSSKDGKVDGSDCQAWVAEPELRKKERKKIWSLGLKSVGRGDKGSGGGGVSVLAWNEEEARNG